MYAKFNKDHIKRYAQIRNGSSVRPSDSSRIESSTFPFHSTRDLHMPVATSDEMDQTNLFKSSNNQQDNTKNLTDKDLKILIIRNNMIKMIIEMLRTFEPSLFNSLSNNIIEMAKTMEEIIYVSSDNILEYENEEVMKQKLYQYLIHNNDILNNNKYMISQNEINTKPSHSIMYTNADIEELKLNTSSVKEIRNIIDETKIETNKLIKAIKVLRKEIIIKKNFNEIICANINNKSDMDSLDSNYLYIVQQGNEIRNHITFKQNELNKVVEKYLELKKKFVILSQYLLHNQNNKNDIVMNENLKNVYDTNENMNRNNTINKQCNNTIPLPFNNMIHSSNSLTDSIPITSVSSDHIQTRESLFLSNLKKNKDTSQSKKGKKKKRVNNVEPNTGINHVKVLKEKNNPILSNDLNNSSKTIIVEKLKNDSKTMKIKKNKIIKIKQNQLKNKNNNITNEKNENSDIVHVNDKKLSNINETKTIHSNPNTVTQDKKHLKLEGTSLLNQLSNENIKIHLKSLCDYNMYFDDDTLQIRNKWIQILKKLIDSKHGWIFSAPVDPESLQLPDYFNIIKNPMDLGTILNRLNQFYYNDVQLFEKDVRLVFNNAMLYNEENTVVHKQAKILLQKFETLMSIPQIDPLSKNNDNNDTTDNTDNNGKNGNNGNNSNSDYDIDISCYLCGNDKLMFEPPVLFCNGPCNVRIRRNSYYYSSKDNSYYCCQSCYNNTKSNDIILTKKEEKKEYKKKDLIRKKNSEVNEEPWVQCDHCNRWSHQVCSLFNGKNEKLTKINGNITNNINDSRSEQDTTDKEKNQDKDQNQNRNQNNCKNINNIYSTSFCSPSSCHPPNKPFYCGQCLIKLREKDSIHYPIQEKVLSATRLPKTKLSNFLEEYLKNELIKVINHDENTNQRVSHNSNEGNATDIHCINSKEIRHYQIAKSNKSTNNPSDTYNNKKKLIDNVSNPETINECIKSLVIRQVSNVKKTLRVKEKIVERYNKEDSYPSQFEYMSKSICLFQEIDGVSTLLFSFYVQEFDDSVPEPNKGRVYISYLDSVNFLRPKALRTQIYHIIIRGYLLYAKRNKFHTVHLWACPPLKGDDYIFNCHPENQKTPKPDRLRSWYLSLLKLAQENGIVTKVANVYNEYFHGALNEIIPDKLTSGKSRKDNINNINYTMNNCNISKKSLKDLPYFEDDYWIGVAEDFISQMEKAKSPHKSRKVDNPTVNKNKSNNKKNKNNDHNKKTNRKSLLKNLDSVSSNNSQRKEIIDPLQKKLGDVLYPMRYDFLVISLQHKCNCCNKFILSGTRWKDPNTSTSDEMDPAELEFNLCVKCYTDQLPKDPKEQYPYGKDHVTPLIPVSVYDGTVPFNNNVDPSIAKDSDCCNDFFETRQSFLSLCQGNHYQFDELRRAKHSSMMLLYHINNPDAPAFVYECNNCNYDITPLSSKKRWHCLVCPDFDICDKCHDKTSHHHNLKGIPFDDKILDVKDDRTLNRKKKDKKSKRKRGRSIEVVRNSRQRTNKNILFDAKNTVIPTVRLHDTAAKVNFDDEDKVAKGICEALEKNKNHFDNTTENNSKYLSKGCPLKLCVTQENSGSSIHPCSNDTIITNTDDNNSSDNNKSTLHLKKRKFSGDCDIRKKNKVTCNQSKVS